MMLLGHGIDIVALNRFSSMTNRRLNKIALRICTEDELNEFTNHPKKYQYLAKIWAGKEAIIKASGQGITKSTTWKSIKITSDSYGKPRVWFRNDIKGLICHLSISHEKDFLIASAILETV